MQKIQNHIRNRRLGLALEELRPIVSELGNSSINDRYDTLYNEYRYMLHFLSNGGDDVQREELYEKMIKRADILVSDIIHISKQKNLHGIEQLQSSLKGHDISCNALIASLRQKDVNTGDIVKNLEIAFNAIFLSLQWKQQEQRTWTAFLLDSGTPIYVSQTILSAIMLSCREVFCIEKFRTMFYVYLTTDNQKIKQRALVGWASCIDQLHDTDMLSELSENDAIKSDLSRLAMQIIICTEAEKTHKHLEKNIYPNIINQTNLAKFNHIDDIVKSHEETIDDIINPGKEEEAMNKMEDSIREMQKMQEAGADIYYVGFRIMKRYPFFYRLANWFIPFIINHPDIDEAKKKISCDAFIQHLMTVNPICDSDKYSLILGLAGSIASIPNSMRDAIMKNEAPLDSIGNIGSGMEQSPEYLMRSYLQDLYRYYSLSPTIKLETIFCEKTLLAIYRQELMQDSKYDYCNFLLRHGRSDIVEKILGHIDVNDINTKEQALLYASYFRARNFEEQLFLAYKKVLSYDDVNKVALRGIARYSYITANYVEASVYYKKLHDMYPEVLSYAINYIKSELANGNAKDVLNMIFQLDYEHEANYSIKQTLAWVMLCNNRTEPSLKLSRQIVNGDFGDSCVDDKLFLATALWVSNNIKESVHYLADILRSDNSSNRIIEFQNAIDSNLTILSKYFTIRKSDSKLIVDAAHTIIAME